jgi:hypothetical protein
MEMPAQGRLDGMSHVRQKKYNSPVNPKTYQANNSLSVRLGNIMALEESKN